MPSDSPEPAQSLDLSDLQMMPDWVTELDTDGGKAAAVEKYDSPRYQEREAKGPRDFKRKGGGGGGPRGRNDRNDRQGRGRPGGNRQRDGRGGRDGRRDGRGKRGRGGKGDGREQRGERIPPNLSVSVRPTQQSLEALVSRIRISGRAFALFDLAKLVLAGFERFEVGFDCRGNGAKPGGGRKGARQDTGRPGAKPNANQANQQAKSSGVPARLIQCRADHSVWLNKEDALRHFLASPKRIETFYDVEETRVDAPKGEFHSVAICGLTGELLGPPNHHSYQTAVARHHRLRFPNMPIERFRGKIRIETNDDLVAKWKESLSKVTVYRFPKKPAEEEPAADAETQPEAENSAETAVETPPDEQATTAEAETADAEAADTAESAETPETTAESPDSAENAAQPPEDAADAPVTAESEPPASPESAAETKPEEAEASEAADSPAPPAENDDRLKIESLEALERHANAHLAGEIFKEVDRAWVPGKISGKDLPPPLFNLMRREVEHLRRSPFPVVREMCSDLERRGLKIFKRQGKKLFVSKARPRPIAPDTALSEPIQHIVDAVQAQPGIKVSQLVTSLAPRRKSAAPEVKEGEFTPEETQVLTNLHWLVDEGFIIEYASSALFLGGQPQKRKTGPASEKTEDKPEDKAKAEPLTEAKPEEKAADAKPDATPEEKTELEPKAAPSGEPAPEEAPQKPETSPVVVAGA